jgi:RNA recognition motif-containing protein
MFSEFGSIASVKISKHKSDQMTQIASILFNEHEEAKKAFEAMNGKLMNGRALHIEITRESPTIDDEEERSMHFRRNSEEIEYNNALALVAEKRLAEFKTLLLHLTTLRNSIKQAMVFAMENAEYYSQVFFLFFSFPNFCINLFQKRLFI